MLPTHGEMSAKWTFFLQPVDKQRDKETFEQFHTKATEIKVITSNCYDDFEIFLFLKSTKLKACG